MENCLLRSVGKLRLFKESREVKFIELINHEDFKRIDNNEQKRLEELFQNLVKKCGNEIGIIKTTKDEKVSYSKRLFGSQKENRQTWDCYKKNQNIVLKALENLSTMESGESFRIVDLIEFSTWADLEKDSIDWINNALHKIIIKGMVGFRIDDTRNELDIKVYNIV